MGQGDSGMTQIVTNSSETLIPAENDRSETIIHSLSFMFLHADRLLMINSAPQAKMLINLQLIYHNRVSQYVFLCNLYMREKSNYHNVR